MQVDRALILITITATILFVGLAVFPAAESTIEDGGGVEVTHQAAVFEGAGTFASIGSQAGVQESVFKTTGHAVELTGADDSFVESASDFTVSSGDNWTVSVWALVDSGQGDENMTAVSVDGRAVISFNGSADQWEGWFFDEGSRASFQANVSASGNEVGNFTNVILWHNGTHLSIFRNGTRGDITATAGNGFADAPVNATNWDGRLEELRTFGDAVDSTDRSELVNSPVDGQPDTDRTARAMFDQPDAATQLLLFTDTHLTTSNTSFAPGFARDEMQGSGNLIGGDYRWRESGPQIAPIAGSELGDAPVAYVNYTRLDPRVNDIRTGIETSYSLVEVVYIVLLIGSIVVALRVFGTRG